MATGKAKGRRIAPLTCGTGAWGRQYGRDASTEADTTKKGSEGECGLKSKSERETQVEVERVGLWTPISP